MTSTVFSSQEKEVIRGTGLGQVRAIMAERGIDPSPRSEEADALLAELTRLANFPDPAPIDLSKADSIEKAFIKFDTERSRAEAIRQLAAEHLPAVQSQTDDFVTADGVAAVVDELVADFARNVDIARTSAATVPDIEPSQLQHLSVSQFEAFGALQTSVARIEHAIAERIDVASFLGEPLSVSTDLRSWGKTPVIVAILTPPPRDRKEVVDAYAPLFAAMTEIGSMDPVHRVRRLLELEAAGTLTLRLAGLGEADARIAVAKSWWGARWSAQSAYELPEFGEAIDNGNSMWRSLSVR